MVTKCNAGKCAGITGELRYEPAIRGIQSRLWPQTSPNLCMPLTVIQTRNDSATLSCIQTSGGDCKKHSLPHRKKKKWTEVWDSGKHMDLNSGEAGVLV